MRDGSEGLEGWNALGTPWVFPQFSGCHLLCHILLASSAAWALSLVLASALCWPLCLYRPPKADHSFWFFPSLPDSDTTSQQRAWGLAFQITLKGAQMMPLRNVLGLTPCRADFGQCEKRDGWEMDRYILSHPSFHLTAPRDC